MDEWETMEVIYPFDWRTSFRIQAQRILGWKFYRYKMLADWTEIKCYIKRKIQQG